MNKLVLGAFAALALAACSSSSPNPAPTPVDPGPYVDPVQAACEGKDRTDPECRKAVEEALSTQ